MQMVDLKQRAENRRKVWGWALFLCVVAMTIGCSRLVIEVLVRDVTALAVFAR
jgi:hypothetical protein